MTSKYFDERCFLSKSNSFCKLLMKKGVPLDNKWPPILFGLRAAALNPVYTADQKVQLQNILIDAMGRKQFTDNSYYELQRQILHVIVSPMEQKIQEINNEVQAISVEVNQLLGKHSDDVSLMADEVDKNIALGKGPQETLSELRTTLRAVVKSFAVDRARFETLSSIDSLTRLANRRKFDMRLKECVLGWQTANVPVSLILFDIDHFKAINDTHGHLVGDQILTSVGKLIKHTLANLQEDCFLAARYGGDEFAIILQGPLVARTQALSEVLRNVVARARFTIKSLNKEAEELDVKATISLGSSTLVKRSVENDEQRLIGYADKALYYAKANGRNRSVYYSPLDQGSYVMLPGAGENTEIKN